MSLTSAVTSDTFTVPLPSMSARALSFGITPRIMFTSVVTSLTFTAPSPFTSPKSASVVKVPEFPIRSHVGAEIE